MKTAGMATCHSTKINSDTATDTQTVFFDESVDIRIVGLEPNQSVTLRACISLDGHTWKSQTMFRADEAGVVNIASQQPIGRGYDTADPMGPFWSMQRVSGTSDSVESEPVEATTVTLTVRTDGETVGSTKAKACLRRVRRYPFVRSRERVSR
jgi:hypothetical protein